MKILLEISPDHYDRMLSGVSEKSLLYGVLKDGVVIYPTKAGAGSRMIEILCEKFHARMLVALAENLSPQTPCPRLKRQSDFLECTTNRRVITFDFVARSSSRPKSWSGIFGA